MNLNSFKKKVQKSITLQQLYDAVMELAKGMGQEYVQVSVTKNTHDGIKLTGYIHTLSHVSGKTIQEVCDGLRNYREPEKKSPIEEVIIN